MKKIVKDIFAQIDYFLYRNGFKKCKIRKVHSVAETIDELIYTQKSMVRFGDGEIAIIRGKQASFQKGNPKLVEDLKRILSYQYDNLIVTIPDIFYDLSIYRKASRQFWKDHLLFCRKIYEKYCDTNKEYFNTSVSRFYYTLEDKSQSERWISKIRQIWKDCDVVIVEGVGTHNGVGNNLLDTARTIERIIGPARNAYEKLEEIFEACIEYPKDRLFLISLGPTAKPLTERLFLEGYRVLDIGNLDMEYEWYLRKASKKEKIPKHDMIDVETNRQAGYTDYLAQIKKRIEL